MTLHERVLAVLKKEGWGAGDLALRCPEMSRQSMEFYLVGRYQDTARKTAVLEEFLRRHARGEFAEPPAEVVTIEQGRKGRRPRKDRPARAHYQTRFCARVEKALEYTADEARLTLITSEYGNGKTHAAYHWRAERIATQDCAVMTFRGVNRTNVYGFMGAAAAMVGLSCQTYSPRALAAAYGEIVERLRERPTLLIFDQCDYVSTAVLQIIRDIHDETQDAGAGVALLAAPLLYRRLWRERSKDIGALTSRIEHFAIPGIEADEPAGIAEAEGLNITPEGLRAWHESSEGSMRVVMHVLDLLRRGHKGKLVMPKVIEGVCKHLMSGQASTARLGGSRPTASGETRRSA